MVGVPPLICSAQGNAPLATKPVNMPWALVVTEPIKPEPSAHFATTLPPTMGAPTAAVPVNCSGGATLLEELPGSELLLSELELTLLTLLSLLLETLLVELVFFLSLSLPQPDRTNRPRKPPHKSFLLYMTDFPHDKFVTGYLITKSQVALLGGEGGMVITALRL